VPQTVIVSFKAPAELVDRIDDLVKTGLFRNRSEALRHALVLLVNKYGGGVGEGEAGERGGRGFAKAAGGDFQAHY